MQVLQVYEFCAFSSSPAFPPCYCPFTFRCLVRRLTYGISSDFHPGFQEYDVSYCDAAPGRCTRAAWPSPSRRSLPQPHAKRHGRGRGCRAPWLAPFPVATHQGGQATRCRVLAPLGVGQVTATEQGQLGVLVADQRRLALAFGPEEIAGAVEELGGAIQLVIVG